MLTGQRNRHRVRETPKTDVGRTKGGSSPGESDDKYGKAAGEPGGQSILHHILAMMIGGIIYVALIRPVVVSVVLGEGLDFGFGMSVGVDEDLPEGSNLAMAAVNETSVLFASCGQSMWCSLGDDSSGSCFEAVKTKVPNERLIRYSCGAGDPGTGGSRFEWLSYAKQDGGFRIGLWKNKINAIPFLFYPNTDGSFNMQCKYPASAYDFWLSADPKTQSLSLVSSSKMALAFGFVDKGPSTIPPPAAQSSSSSSSTTTRTTTTTTTTSSSRTTTSAAPTHPDLSKKYKYLGCYKDTYERDFKGRPAAHGKVEFGGRHQGYDVQMCGDACKSRGYKYFALQAYRTEAKSHCFCGNSYGNGAQHVKVADSDCGSKTQCIVGPCGLSMRNAVYENI
eukprot:CAMPEP_0197517414 /NCGR_PEP_ID=MMETSP1318-20131121/2416_1 /TAXON_ID=552666 /ORGANISM="Partenskyella glossopodia, Strain RCC365" /LENGTH=392 /DNA_ID=CAMNT_0043066945 /DNA_START=98 /DNA_END=1276 /DNA_ORIENTATION=+